MINLITPLNGRTDVQKIEVTLSGKDVEYWGNHYGAQFKDMNLYVVYPPVTLLNDSSDWHADGTNAIDRVDTSDGVGREI